MRFAVLLSVLVGGAAPVYANTCSATGDPVAITNSFSAGALIIPMDSCYNPDQTTATPKPLNTAGSCVASSPSHSNGSATCYAKYSTANIRHPFGMLYLLAENNIPVNIILNQTKLGLADEDFHVTPPTGATAPNTVTYLAESSGVYKAVAASSGVDCGVNTVYYSGMPFVVDATYAQQALAVIQAFNAAQSGSNKDLFGDVPMHIINYPFTAPVLGILESRPKPVLIDNSPLDTFFDESGIPLTVATSTTFIQMNGTYTFNWPSSLGSNGVCTNNCATLYNSSGSNFIDVVWSSNSSKGNDHGNLANWTAMPKFLQQGGTVLAVDSGQTWESGSAGGFGGTLEQTSASDNSGPFCTGVGVKHIGLVPLISQDLSKPGPTSQYPASNRFLQVDAMNFVVHGNGGGADGTSTWDFKNSPTVTNVHGLSNGNGYVSLAGHPMVSGSQVSGNLVYLGSLNSWHGGSTNKDGGLHIMYNTLLVGNGCGTTNFTSTELTRSTAVASYSSTGTKVAEYLGTYDWYIPKSASAMGNSLYQPDPSVYPYTTGHFREYKASGSFTANSSTDYKNCSSSNTLSACNWDAATQLPKFASRNVFAVTGSSAAWTIKTVSSLTATDTTLSYISGKLDKTVSGVTSGVLGGIDWSTAAVIEALPSGLVSVGNSKTRPTIAYVGSRDGMLHAFCVSTSCYGKNAGDEIWAMITPGMKALMTSAYNGGTNMDWSKVNLGGIIRVADVKDDFEGHTGVYRTVLIVGAHDYGYVDAIDISDPDPSNINKDGFSFLWEQDGTTKSDGTTNNQPMGKTWGASFALTGSNGGAIAAVTSATCYGMGFSTAVCPTSVTPGENTYVLRMKDGLVVNVDQKLYTRTTSLFGATIPNDVPAPPTTLDADDDTFDETILVPALDGYVYRYTLKSGTAPTLASLDTSKNKQLFDASSGCTTGIACEPIGSPVTIVRNLHGTEFGALVVTGGVDWARDPIANQTYHIYDFDPESTSSGLATAFASQALPSVTPPVSSAPGSGSGVTGTAMALRGYAQMMVSGSDLYSDLTSLSIGTMSEMVQPLITPGSYGTVLRFPSVNDGSSIGTAVYAVTQGATFAGGAGATFTFSTSTGGEALFAADVSGASSKSMQSAPSSSTPSSAFAVNLSNGGTGGRTFTVQTWFDGLN